MVKKRYTFSSSDDEPSESPARGRKKPSLPPPPRPLRTIPHIDLSSDDDLFRRRPKATHQDVKARPSTSKHDAAENSSSESEFEFNYKKALKRHNERRQRKEKDVEREEREQKDKGPDWCSSCSGSVCGDCTKEGTKKQGRLLARVQNERMQGNELVESREIETRNVERGAKAARASHKRSTRVEPESMESSEDDGLMASKSYRLLERHLRRKESERGENQAFSTNDEPLRKTFEENLTPRKQSRQKFVWDSDSGEELAVQRMKHDRSGAVARSRGVVVRGPPSPVRRSSAHRGESEEDTDDDLDLLDRNLSRDKQHFSRSKGDQRLAKAPGIRRREQFQLEPKKKNTQHGNSEKVTKPKSFAFHEDYVQLKKPMVSVLEGGHLDRHTGSEQLVWDRKKHRESLAKLSDAAPHEWRPKKRETFAEVNDSASGRYKAINDDSQGRRVYLRDQATSPIKSRVASPEVSKKGIGVGRSHTNDQRFFGPSIDSASFAKVAGAACTVMESPSYHGNENESRVLFRRDPGRDVDIHQGRSRSTRRTRSPSQRTHSAPASECRDAYPNEGTCHQYGTNSTPHRREKQQRRVEDEGTQGKSGDFRRETAAAQEGPSRELQQSREYQPYSDDSRAEGEQERRDAIEPRQRSWGEGTSARRSQEIEDKRESSQRDQTGDSGATNFHKDRGGALASIDTKLDLNKASQWNSFDDSRGIRPHHGEPESPRRSQQAGPVDDQDVNVLLEKTVSEAVRIVGDKLISKMSKRDSKVEGLINGCMDNCVQLGGEISDLRCNVQASTARQEEKIRRLIEEARPINETVKELQEKFRRGDLENTVGRTSEVLRGLSSRLDHLESRMAGQLDRLSKYSQQTLEERISQTQTQPSGSQESRLQDLENTIHELKNTIRSPKTVARLEQDIRRVQGEVGQCLEEVVNCRSENKGSLNKMRDGIARLEEDFRRTTSETRSKIDFLETKVGTVHDRVRGLEKSEASAKSGIRRTEHKIENVEILVEQVAAACNATVKAVDQKHLRFKNSLRVIKEAAAVTNAKCDALAEAMAKLHKDTVGKTDDKLRETRDSNTRDAPNKAQECHHDREYLAHVTVERTGKERKPGDARKHQYLVKDKGPILQTPGARTVEVIPSKPPVHR